MDDEKLTKQQDDRISVPMSYISLCSDNWLPGRKSDTEINRQNPPKRPNYFCKGTTQQRNNNNNNGISAQGGVEKHRFQQSTSTHTGTGEKETLNINVVGKTSKAS